MPPWSIHNKWCIRLGCSADVCREANYIVDSALAHDLGRRRIVDSDTMVKKVFHGVSHDFLRKFSEVEKAFERKIGLIMINYRLRVDECLRKAFYLHHALDVLLNTLIPVNNIFNNVRSLDELVQLALNYLDLLNRTLARMPEPNDGFQIKYHEIRKGIEKVLMFYKDRLVRDRDEALWVKGMEKEIRRKMLNACKFGVTVKFSWKYVEGAKKLYYMPGIPSDMVESVAVGQVVKWFLGRYRSKLVRKLMLCSGLYHYTLLDPWNSGIPLYILRHVKKAVRHILTDLKAGVDFNTAVNYALSSYPFNKYPYPRKVLVKLVEVLKGFY